MIVLHQPPPLIRIVLFFILPLVIALWGLSLILPQPAGRVIVLGLDSLSPRQVHAMVERGKMPNFRWLMEHGYFNRLQTDISSLSRIVWPIIETGRPPEVNGITGTGRTHINYTVEDMRQVPSVWEITTKARLTAAVWNPYESFPGYTINGIFMSDRWLNETLSRNTPGVYYPFEMGSELADQVSWGWKNSPYPNYCDYITDGQGWNTDFMTNPNFKQYFFKKNLAFRVEFGGIAPLAARLSGSYDLTYYYNNTTDNFSHILLEGGAAGQSRFEAMYEMDDALVGNFLDNMGPNDHLIIISDHGFNPLPAGPGNSVLIRRKAAGNYNALLGVLHQNAEEAAIITSISEESEGWRVAFDPNCNPLLMRRFITRLDLLYGEDMTDMRLEHAHTSSGISGTIVVYGPGVAHVSDAAERPHVLNITPTILYLLDIPVGADMEGGVARSVFDEGWLRRHPVKTVPTWGTRQGAAKSDISPEHLAEMKTLGYIE
jgi:predicted AlkP superfamily phosphohydrolase/phosphomutase